MHFLEHLIMWAAIGFDLLFPRKKETSPQQVCTEGEPAENPPQQNENEIRPESLSLFSPRKSGIDWDKVVNKRPILHTEKTAKKVGGLLKRVPLKVSEIIKALPVIQIGRSAKIETSPLQSRPTSRNKSGEAIVVPFNPTIGSLRNATASGGEPCSYRPTH